MSRSLEVGQITQTDGADTLALIYQRYATTLLDVAQHIVRCHADAEDVVHDVFVRLPSALRDFRGGAFGAWLRCITKRTALMHLRNVKRRREEGFPEATVCAPRDSTELALVTLGRREDLRVALTRLPEEMRMVVVLRFYLDYNHREIAATLGISPNASEVRLCRALKRMRRTLRVKHGSVHSRTDRSWADNAVRVTARAS